MTTTNNNQTKVIVAILALLTALVTAVYKIWPKSNVPPAPTQQTTVTQSPTQTQSTVVNVPNITAPAPDASQHQTRRAVPRVPRDAGASTPDLTVKPPPQFVPTGPGHNLYIGESNSGIVQNGDNNTATMNYAAQGPAPQSTWLGPYLVADNGTVPSSEDCSDKPGPCYTFTLTVPKKFADPEFKITFSEPVYVLNVFLLQNGSGKAINANYAPQFTKVVHLSMDESLSPSHYLQILVWTYKKEPLTIKSIESILQKQ